MISAKWRFSESLCVAMALSTAGGFLSACDEPQSYDVILRNGTIFDGGGGDPFCR